MHTLKKFIHYYGPYKAVFFLDLICATIISLVDLAYPQILRTCTNTLFTKSSSYFKRTASIAAGSSDHVPDPEPVQILCQLSGAYDGRLYGTGYASAAFLTTMKKLFYYDQNNSDR